MWFSVSRGTDTQPGLTEYSANRIIPTLTSKAPFGAIAERKKSDVWIFKKKKWWKKLFISGKEKNVCKEQKFWLTFSLFHWQNGYFYLQDM